MFQILAKTCQVFFVGMPSYRVTNLSLGCVATVTIVVVVIILCRRHMVIEEPHTPNPLKLIFRVVWYSRKVHSSHQVTISAALNGTSAVMPFTAREVDDVKTFFRLLPVFVPLGLLMAAQVASTLTAPVFSNHNFSDGTITHDPLLLVSYSIPFLVVPLSILLYRAVWANTFCSITRHAPRILNRVCVGALLMALTMVAAVIAYGLGFDSVEFYMTVSGLNGLSVFLVVSAVFEFICAQSPYSMRSMMISIIYATEGLGNVAGTVLLVAILIPLSFGSSSEKPPRTGSVVYYSISAALTIVALAIAIFNAKRYRTRRRLDRKYEDAYADRVSILSSMTSSIEIVADHA